MKHLFTVTMAIAMLSGSPSVSDADKQELYKLQDVSCRVFQVYHSNPEVLRPVVILYFDGLLNGAAAGHVPTAFFMEEFEAICSADPTTKIEAALEASRNAVLDRMK